MIGQQRKDDGIERVVDNSDGLAAELTNYVVAFARHNTVVTADDLRNICEELGIELHHPNLIGAVFSQASRAGLIKRVGYQESLAASRHRGVIRTWAAV